MPSSKRPGVVRFERKSPKAASLDAPRVPTLFRDRVVEAAPHPVTRAQRNRGCNWDTFGNVCLYLIVSKGADRRARCPTATRTRNHELAAASWHPRPGIRDVRMPGRGRGHVGGFGGPDDINRRFKRTMLYTWYTTKLLQHLHTQVRIFQASTPISFVKRASKKRERY